MRSRHRAWRPHAALAAAILSVLACSGCFDDPIEERLEIFFHWDGSVEVSAVTTIRESWRDEGPSGVRRRLDQLRDSLLHDEDVWSRGIRAMEPERERVALEYEKGQLVAAQRQALSSDPAAIEDLFSVTPVAAVLEREDGILTLELTPSGARRATRRQAERVEEALDSFASAASAYLEALAALYRHLEDRPELQRWAMASLLDIEMEEPEGAAPTAETRRLIEAAGEADDGLVGILTVDEEEAYSLDELSRLVHDPFPAPVTVEVTGNVLEVVGFVTNVDGLLATRSHSLWDGLAALEGRWVAPLPVVAMVAALRTTLRSEDLEDAEDDDDEEPDHEALLDMILPTPPTVAGVPGEGEVREALLESLRPPDLYRVRWRSGEE